MKRRWRRHTIYTIPTYIPRLRYDADTSTPNYILKRANKGTGRRICIGVIEVPSGTKIAWVTAWKNSKFDSRRVLSSHSDPWICIRRRYIGVEPCNIPIKIYLMIRCKENRYLVLKWLWERIEKEFGKNRRTGESRFGHGVVSRSVTSSPILNPDHVR